MRINTNVQSSFAIRRLGEVNRDLDGNFSSLSSGDRITTAANDPSGLAISEGLKAKSRSIAQARRNANDGISFFQIAEGSFNTLQAYATRMRELAMQSANASYSDSERNVISKEFEAIKNDIKRITSGAVTNIYGNRDSQKDYEIQIGSGSSQSDDRLRYSTEEIYDTKNYYGVDKVRVGTAGEARASLGEISKIINRLSSSRARIGSYQKKLQHSINNLDTSKINIDDSNSKIRDADVAEEVSKKTSNEIRQKATSAMLNMVNSRPNAVLKLVG